MAPRQFAATVLDPENTPEFDQLYGGIGPAAFELWEDARAETARLAWVPYLHNPSLPHLLGVIDKLPTLLVWGRQDKVSPLSAGEALQQVDRRLEAGGVRPMRPSPGNREERGLSPRSQRIFELSLHREESQCI